MFVLEYLIIIVCLCDAPLHLIHKNRTGCLSVIAISACAAVDGSALLRYWFVVGDKGTPHAEETVRWFVFVPYRTFLIVIYI